MFGSRADERGRRLSTLHDLIESWGAEAAGRRARVSGSWCGDFEANCGWYGNGGGGRGFIHNRGEGEVCR